MFGVGAGQGGGPGLSRRAAGGAHLGELVLEVEGVDLLRLAYAAQRLAAARLVHRRTDDGEVEPVGIQRPGLRPLTDQERMQPSARPYARS